MGSKDHYHKTIKQDQHGQDSKQGFEPVLDTRSLLV